MALTARIGPLALALLPLAFFACGEDDEAARGSSGSPRQFGSQLTGSEARQAEATVRDYFEARAEQQWARACSYLTEPTRRLIDRLAPRSESFPGTDCPSFIASSVEGLSAPKRAALDQVTIDSVRADGDRGYALYRPRGEGQQAIPIRVEGGWKLDAPTGTSLERHE